MFELLHSKLRQLSHSYSPNHSQYMPESNFKETNVKKERQREREKCSLLMKQTNDEYERKKKMLRKDTDKFVLRLPRKIFMHIWLGNDNGSMMMVYSYKLRPVVCCVPHNALS